MCRDTHTPDLTVIFTCDSCQHIKPMTSWISTWKLFNNTQISKGFIQSVYSRHDGRTELHSLVLMSKN